MKKNNYGERPRGSHQHERQNSSLDYHNLQTREFVSIDASREGSPTENPRKSEDNNGSDYESEYSQRPISHLMGLFWCIVQGLTRGAMYSGQKMAHEATHVKLSHIVLIRSLFIMLGAQIYAWKDGKSTSLVKVYELPIYLKKSLFLRSFYGYAAIVAAMIAILLCPVSMSVSIMMTQVFMSALAGYFMNNEIISRMEILSICGGFFGVLILTNEHFFHKAGMIRYAADQKKYPHYYIGVIMAVLYTTFSALNFYEMRKMGHGVHSSIKTFYFGALCSLGTFLYILAVESENVFQKKEFPITWSQFTASMIVGFFSWANQESLSLSLTVVKQGTASAFNNLALIVSLMVDAFYFKRKIFIHDIFGVSLIIIFAVTQSLLANQQAKSESSPPNNSSEADKKDDEEEKNDGKLKSLINKKQNSQQDGQAQRVNKDDQRSLNTVLTHLEGGVSQSPKDTDATNAFQDDFETEALIIKE